MSNQKSNKITVLHLIGTLGIGGAEQALLTLAPHFDHERFRIIVCTLQPGGKMEERLDLDNVELKTVDFRLRHLPLAIWKLYRMIRREKVDILHMHMYGAGLYGRIAGVLAGRTKMITTDHGKGLWKKPRQVAFDRIANRFTDLKIAVSQDIADIMKKRERISDDNKVVVVPNGVDVKRFQPNADTRQRIRLDLGITDGNVLICTLARLVEAKALHIMIKAIADVVKTHPQVILAIVGDGPLRNDLEKCAADCGMTDYVLFTGARADIPEMLSASDIYAISSIREGLPVSLLEAMSAGKPIVATNVGGIPETIEHNKDGLIVESENPEAFADAIRKIVDDLELALRMGEHAREKATSDYSIGAVAGMLEDIYKSLMEQGR